MRHVGQASVQGYARPAVARNTAAGTKGASGGVRSCELLASLQPSCPITTKPYYRATIAHSNRFCQD